MSAPGASAAGAGAGVAHVRGEASSPAVTAADTAAGGGGWIERQPPAWTITAALAVVYLVLAPSSPDLAAASYRSWLFAQHGLLLWDNSWYGGHHLLAYSLLAPPLGALIGPRLVAAASMTLATFLFTALIDGLFPPRAVRIASVWFAIGASIGLLSSRVPFDLGLAIGLGALLATRRERPWGALTLALLCSLASPVAGAFLALAYVALCLAGPARAWPAALAVAALAPIVALAVVFPEGGSQPFVASAFYPALLGVAVIALLIPREQRALRIGAWLYAGALIASYVLSTAVGGNADRLGSLLAGPIAACALLGAAASARDGARRRTVLLVLAPFLLYWQANAPVADFAASSSDPAVKESYYAPLLGELRALDVGYGGRPVRLEVVPTVDHWEARWVAPHAMIARGWERQLDRYRNGLFYASAPVTAAAYRDWLARTAVAYVALPDAPLDYSAHSEARLLRSGALGDVREIWHSRHWRLYAVLGARALAEPPALLERTGVDSFEIYAPRAGAYTVRVRFTPYWKLAGAGGCVARAGEDWTQIRVRRPGRARVVIDFSPARVFSDGARCN